MSKKEKAIIIRACYECIFCKMKEEGFYCSWRAIREDEFKFIAGFREYMENPFFPRFCPLPDVEKIFRDFQENI